MIFLNGILANMVLSGVQFYSSSSIPVRFICDNLALPVPCHWERINTDEPYQVCKIRNTLGTGRDSILPQSIILKMY